MSRALSLHLLDNRFPALHGARVVAILSVLQLHVGRVLSWRYHLPDKGILRLSKHLWFGMDLFFILSGFLIGTLLFHQGETISWKGMGRFYARRALRIFPSYYVVLTLVALLPITSHESRMGVGWEFAYLQNYVVAARLPVLGGDWSLAVEEHFYLAAPLCLLAMRWLSSFRWRVMLLGTVFASGTLVRIVDALVHASRWSQQDRWRFLYHRTHDRYDILFAGVLLAFLYSQRRSQIDAVLQKPLARYLLGAIFCVCLLLLLLPRGPIADAALWDALSYGTITSIMYGALLPLLLAGDGFLKRALSAPVFLRLATLGYGVYLVHLPLASFVIVPIFAPLGTLLGLPLGGVLVLCTVALFGSSLGLSYALHLLIEKPALALRDRVVG